MTAFSLDYESSSECDLKKYGLDKYTADPSTKPLMCGAAFDDDEPDLWVQDGKRFKRPFPTEWRKALESPDVEKWAFHAQYERVFTKRVMKIDTPYKGWRCSMVLGHMQSFVGDLGLMGERMMLPTDKLKSTEGKRLIRKFCMPQKVSKNQPLLWRNAETDPDDWAIFCEYCKQDVVAERAIKKRLIGFPVLQSEWELYEIDQEINDRGIPIDMEYVNNAIELSARRKAELTALMEEKTDYELGNVNSRNQLLPWLQARGYPFDDLQKDTVKKVLTENAEKAKEGQVIVEFEDEAGTISEQVISYDGEKPTGQGFMTKQGAEALQLRQQLARSSTAKYTALLKKVGRGNRFRFGLQFGGAARTNRWAGRGLNPQNLARPPSALEICKAAETLGVPANMLLDLATELIRAGDHEGLWLLVDEPLNVLAGLVRSAIRTPDDEHELLACDLSSIETVTSAWLTNCTRLLDLFKEGRDAYKDFAQFMFKCTYEQVTKPQRQKAKPAVLGCCYRLGGGRVIDGKKTGLMGYAEGYGVYLTERESAEAVKVYRDTYPEIAKGWFALEKAVAEAMRSGRAVVPIIRVDGNNFRMPVTVEKLGPYLTIKLPSGRRLYYYKPRMVTKTFRGRPTEAYPDGEPYKRTNLTYMGKRQNGNSWTRVESHGGKLFENIVQAVARDILAVGIRRAHDAGWKIIMHVHDEIVALIRKGSTIRTVAALRELMIAPISWCADMPLNAAGWAEDYYRKD